MVAQSDYRTHQAHALFYAAFGFRCPKDQEAMRLNETRFCQRHKLQIRIYARDGRPYLYVIRDYDHISFGITVDIVLKKWAEVCESPEYFGMIVEMYRVEFANLIERNHIYETGLSRTLMGTDRYQPAHLVEEEDEFFDTYLRTYERYIDDLDNTYMVTTQINVLGGNSK